MFKPTLQNPVSVSDYDVFLIIIYLWFPQVIFKKFNIPCPLVDQHQNNFTSVIKHMNVTDDFCEPKMFTTNSQVRGNICTIPARLACQIHSHVLVWLTVEVVMSTEIKFTMSTVVFGLKYGCVLECLSGGLFTDL